MTHDNEKDAIEAAFWKNLGEQAEYGPSVDFDWLLGAVLDALPSAEEQPR